MRRIALALLVLLPLSAAAQSGAACNLVSKQGARVLHAAVEKETPLVLDDCVGVRVVSGELTAVFLSAAGRPASATFSAGQTIALQRSHSGASSAGKAMPLGIIDVLRAPSQVGTFGTRGGAVSAVPDGLVLGLDASIRFDLGPAEPVAGLELRTTSGRTAFRASNPTSPIVVDLAKLRRGETYLWSVNYQASAARAEGRFGLASATQLQQARAALAAVDRNPDLEATGRMLVKAEWLHSNYYRYDARELLRAGGFALEGR